jgi:hypothetical protein
MDEFWRLVEQITRQKPKIETAENKNLLAPGPQKT